MAWKHEVDRKMADHLGGLNRHLSEIAVRRIVDHARAQFSLSRIEVMCNHETRAQYKYGDATKMAGGSYRIRLMPAGMNTLSVLHELAHCFPDGYDHYIGWTFAFFRLADWFKREGAHIIQDAIREQESLL